MCLALQDAAAQGMGQNKNKFIRKMQRVVWTAGISWVAVDDDGKPFKQLFDVASSWNVMPFPTRLSLEGFIANGWSAEGSFTFTRYKSGKTINNDIFSSNGRFIAVDANARYTSHGARTLSPSVIAGIGYTYRSALEKGKSCPTLNIGLGLTVWLRKGFGIGLQSLAKFGAFSRGANYLLHSAGLVYRFDLLHGYKAQGRAGRRYKLFRD